ncbi:hypothetical protein XBI1_2740012 [Xenorhabdus bovienii str. Intermedium]|uniref:Uncharacterized protein n=1 Tax=Xenorhabdus bovienii str. Intermedium TaxID=1379677 RepID=A0A077QJ72_XENBV|nr:hypothetical protein XBI1_2740012 [Xenorhabdus bovienii str. Intermedium]
MLDMVHLSQHQEEFLILVKLLALDSHNHKVKNKNNQYLFHIISLG